MHKIRRKKPFFLYKVFWFGILAITISAGLFYVIFFSAWFQITEIQIKGNEKISEQVIQELVQPKIEQQIGFWKTRSIFLANLKEINKTLLKEFPLISEVEIKRDFLDILIIKVKEREPVAVFYWQKGAEIHPTKTDPRIREDGKNKEDEIKTSYGQKFFIDKEGVVFEKIIDNKYQYLKIKSLMPVDKIKLGEKILNKELMVQILKIKQQAEKINISTIKVLIVSDERLNIKTVEGWEVYFNLKDDISNQVFYLNLVLEEKIPAEKRKDLEYIDLRFGNRVFFRY